MSDAVTRVSVEIEGKEISFETGKLAKQASGAVVVRAGDTMVLCTAVAGNIRDVDFLPLTVDVEERQYADLFGKYVTHVSHWTKKEKLRNPLTGRLDDPDEDMMTEVEKTLGMGGKREDFRHEVISRIAAWSIEHPGQKVEFATVFPRQLQQLRDSYFELQKKVVKKTTEDLLVYLAEGAETTRTRLEKESFERVEITLGNLKSKYGYCDRCARDSVSYLWRKRYS